MSYRINIEIITLIIIICSISIYSKKNTKKAYSFEFVEGDDAHLLYKFDQYLDTNYSADKHETLESEYLDLEESYDEYNYEESDYDDFSSVESEIYEELNTLYDQLDLSENEKELYKRLYEEIYQEYKDKPNGPIQTDIYNYYEETDHSTETFIEVEDSDQPRKELLNISSSINLAEDTEDINFTKLATKICNIYINIRLVGSVR